MTVREKVISEVNNLPDEQLSEILELIHQLRQEAAEKSKADIMSLAGIWSDMPEDAVAELIEGTRRRNSSRRQRIDVDAL